MKKFVFFLGCLSVVLGLVYLAMEYGLAGLFIGLHISLFSMVSLGCKISTLLEKRGNEDVRSEEDV